MAETVIRPEARQDTAGIRAVSVAAFPDRGAKGCVLVGKAGFSSRLGFAGATGLTYEGVPGEHVLGLSFGDAAPLSLDRRYDKRGRGVSSGRDR
jgi:predicted N-acetyltransferase YhbS